MLRTFIRYEHENEKYVKLKLYPLSIASEQTDNTHSTNELFFVSFL